MAAVRRSFELFNAGQVDRLFEETLDPDIDYSGDPDVSALVGSQPDLRGARAVRAVWRAFFEIFDEVQISDIELEEVAPGQVVGSGHMVARGGSSGVPIDAPYYFAWVVRDGRHSFMAAKLDRAAARAALADHLEGRR
jgi:ketosteroid isomerase-like protein